MVTCGYIRPMVTWMVLLSLITQQGYGWNLPNTYYQGADSGGYFGGRGTGSLANQGLGGASAGSWSAGGVGNGAGGGGGGGFQGQTGGGAPGGFGANQWTGDDGSRGTGGLAGGVSTASDGFGADGTGFQQAGGISSGAPLATGSDGDAGYNNQANLGNFGASNVGVSDTNAFAGSFRPSGSGFGAGGHYHGNRPSTYGAPSVQLWRYGTPASYGGYGAARWPWHGHGGYAYPVPVAHINPDGSYSFSYYTPHSSREETGHSNGNVEGTYGFQNDGAKHNFSFNAGPDVDLRSGVGDSRAGVLNPVEYGPQSVHSRARLPLVPQTTFQPGADEQTRTSDTGRAQAPNRWSSRSGAVEGANDQSSLTVVGLPKASSEASDASQPTVATTAATTARNQIVRGSTEPVGAFDLEGREPEGTVTTTPPLGGSVEQVVTRPENEIPSYSNEIAPNDLQYNGVADGGYQPRFGAGTPNIAQTGAVSPDRSYRFGYQTPDAAREETADQAGNVRGSFSYNNAAGRNDLQYVAGAGMGFRPTGGSLSVPNGLGGAGSVADGPGRFFGGAGTGFGNSGVVGNQGGQGVGGSTGGADTGFGGSGVSGNQGANFGGVGAGLSGSGLAENLGGQGLGSTGVTGTGFGANGALGNQGGNFGGVGTGFEGNGVTGNLGGQGVGGSTRGAGTGFGSNGVVGNQGGNFGGVGTGFGDSGVAGIQGGQGVGGNFGGTGTTGFGVERGAGAGGSFGGSTAGFGADGRPRAFGNQGSQVGLGGATGAGFGSDGRPLAFGNQAGGSFGGSNTGFGSDGRPFASGNQGGQLGSGARGTFGGFDGRSFAFGNQAGQGSTVGFTGTQGTTHNPVTRSPSPNAFNGASAGQWNGFNTSGSVSSTEDRADESTTVNDDDSEQTTTFGGYGDVAGAGQLTNGNRRLVQ